MCDSNVTFFDCFGMGAEWEGNLSLEEVNFHGCVPENAEEKKSR